MRNLLIAGFCIMCLGSLAPVLPNGAVSVIRNPTQRAYPSELVRLTVPAPAPEGFFTVFSEGQEIPYQVERVEGTNWIWVCADFAPGQSRTFEIRSGTPSPVPPRVRVMRTDKSWVLDNGRIAVRIPAVAGTQPPGPIEAVRLADRWVGRSAWHTDFRLKAFRSELVGNGKLFGKIRLFYEFDGKAGLNGDVPAFAIVEIRLGPDWDHVEIWERHEMSRSDFWELDLAAGWAPRLGISRPFNRRTGYPDHPGEIPTERPLLPNGLPYQQPDLFINLIPRWNQHFKDGWAFAATDGVHYLGAVVVRAGQWVWPHQNSIRVIVKDSGDYAGLRCPTWKGQRLWWLFGPSNAPMDIAYVQRHAWESLDKLNHEFDLSWPGAVTGTFSGMNIYAGSEVNPTSGIRAVGRRAIAEAGKPGDFSAWTRAQVMFHPDTFGTYWNFWSPENPNFFTDFMRVPIALTTRFKDHPNFERLRRRAEEVFLEDVYHSVTMPGGAGQECPGYLAYALERWRELAPLCREYLGFDPLQWPRIKAAERFLRRISQPDWPVRRMNPIGDTHPGPDGPKIIEVDPAEVRAFVTEELPGFGVIFTHRPGTERETYLSFKSGPNRGHYHGDQLSFHYCANAKPLAVDHHCSYNPRAGQEHMHNRVAFHLPHMPYANMDGYERLIAFKTSPEADVAVGQVESDRLRAVPKYPPEIWHQEYPQHWLKRPLIYRRTIVFIKGETDYFVIRDEFDAPEVVFATYCLHVRAPTVERDGSRILFGDRLTLVCVEPASFHFEPFPWSHKNGGGEATQGARLTIQGKKGQFITVLYPNRRTPPVSGHRRGSAFSVQVGEDVILFDAALGETPPNGTAAVRVWRGSKEVLLLRADELDLNRSQGEVGLFIPDAGYPFGEVPDWLIRQRAVRPPPERMR